MNEVISGIRVIKMYAWEYAFRKVVTKLRRYVGCSVLCIRVIKMYAFRKVVTKLRRYVGWISSLPFSPPSFFLVSCPPRARLPARNSLVNKVEFLGLIPQNGGRPMRLRDR